MISFETYFDESAKQWVIRWSKGEDSVCGYGATLDDALVDFKHSVSSVVNNVENEDFEVSSQTFSVLVKLGMLLQTEGERSDG